MLRHCPSVYSTTSARPAHEAYIAYRSALADTVSESVKPRTRTAAAPKTSAVPIQARMLRMRCTAGYPRHRSVSTDRAVRNRLNVMKLM